MLIDNNFWDTIQIVKWVENIIELVEINKIHVNFL